MPQRQRKAGGGGDQWPRGPQLCADMSLGPLLSGLSKPEHVHRNFEKISGTTFAMHMANSDI